MADQIQTSTVFVEESLFEEMGERITNTTRQLRAANIRVAELEIENAKLKSSLQAMVREYQAFKMRAQGWQPAETYPFSRAPQTATDR